MRVRVGNYAGFAGVLVGGANITGAKFGNPEIQIAAGVKLSFGKIKSFWLVVTHPSK